MAPFWTPKVALQVKVKHNAQLKNETVIKCIKCSKVPIIRVGMPA